MRMPGVVRHGEAVGTFHGLRRESPEYVCWRNMKARCNRPSHPHYKNYGARGITVCDEWNRSFSAFLRDMGRRPSHSHSIERDRNDEGYSPGNCRWALKAEQLRNRRNAVRIEHDGQSMSLNEASERYSIPLERLRGRLFKLGWSVSRALTEPRSTANEGQFKAKPR